MNLRDFERLKEAVDSAERERSELAGELKVNEARLRKEFDCKTVEEAERLLKAEEKAIAKDEAECDQMLDSLRKDFPELFSED